jgi:hypothetical protein
MTGLLSETRCCTPAFVALLQASLLEGWPQDIIVVHDEARYSLGLRLRQIGPLPREVPLSVPLSDSRGTAEQVAVTDFRPSYGNLKVHSHEDRIVPVRQQVVAQQEHAVKQ